MVGCVIGLDVFVGFCVSILLIIGPIYSGGNIPCATLGKVAIVG